MIIRNQTRRTNLANNTLHLVSLRQKSSGLLRKGNNASALFSTRFGIHTFGMKHPIDVLILDRDKRVAILKENLKPNRVFVWHPRYATVLELPEGTIRQTRTASGDKIAIAEAKVI